MNTEFSMTKESVQDDLWAEVSICVAGLDGRFKNRYGNDTFDALAGRNIDQNQFDATLKNLTSNHPSETP